MMAHLASTFAQDTRAAAAAEMALIMPMALALIFTTMEAGYYFQTEHKAAKYMREAARYASRTDFEYFDCSGSGAWQNSSVTGAPSATNVQSQIKNVALSGFPASSSPRIAGWEASDITVSVSCNDSYGTGLYSSLDDASAPIVQVETRFDYTPILGLLGFNVNPIDVVAQAQGAVVGS